MKKYFGTDGIRGEANVMLTPTLSYKAGLSLVTALKEGGIERPQVLIGRDPRLSGAMIESATAAGICAGGGDVIILGVIPTPAVSYLVRKQGASAGVVISASHNPYYDNGIKFFGADGRKFPDEIEERIEHYLERELPLSQREHIGGIHLYREGLADYRDHLRRSFPLDLRGIKIVVDTANGSTSVLAPELLREMGADVVALFCDSDGLNINRDCGSTKPQQMAAAVKEQGAHLGIAYDGDGDRLILADQTGTIVSGDEIMGMIALYLKEDGELSDNRLVVTIVSNLGLRQTMDAAGIAISETKVGDKHVMVEMDRTGAAVGGEQSGHIILSRYNPTGDGILTSLMILKIMLAKGQSLRELAATVTILPQHTINVQVAKRDQWEADSGVQDAIAAAKAALGSEGRILIRPSGTEPLLRVMGEGTNQAELERILDELVAVIQERLA